MQLLPVLDNVELVPTRTSVLSLFSLRKFDENQDLISVMQSVKEVGNWFPEKVELGVICVTVKTDAEFTEDVYIYFQGEEGK